MALHASSFRDCSFGRFQGFPHGTLRSYAAWLREPAQDLSGFGLGGAPRYRFIFHDGFVLHAFLKS
jgi:hypothetical protein